jgi:hypothetical protein
MKKKFPAYTVQYSDLLVSVQPFLHFRKKWLKISKNVLSKNVFI